MARTGQPENPLQWDVLERCLLTLVRVRSPMTPNRQVALNARTVALAFVRRQPDNLSKCANCQTEAARQSLRRPGLSLLPMGYLK